MTGPWNRVPTIQESLSEYGRGIAGGFLFSLPLLFTMEVWQAGLTVSPLRLLIGLGVTLVLLCGFNAFAGLRHDANFTEIVVDSVEELGLGLALSALILLVLGRFAGGAGLTEISGQIVLEGLFVAIGVSVGTAQLAGAGGDERGSPKGRHASIWGELVLAVCGAVLIAANVAPTDEILYLASEMAPWQVIAVCAMSVAVAITLMYFSHFVGSGRFTASRQPFSIVHGSVITYGAALVSSGAMLAFFGRFSGHPAAINVALCIVLGFAATLGASAGRLLLR
jgi:putative integral membrane protein (TIGR02587 family)